MAEEELTIATERGLPFWHGLGTLHKGGGLLLQNRGEESLPVLLKGYREFRATGSEVRVPSYLGVLSDAYTKAARFEDAHQALNEGLAIAEKNDDRCHEAELYRLKGELVLAESSDVAAAEDCFRQAIETARHQQRPCLGNCGRQRVCLDSGNNWAAETRPARHSRPSTARLRKASRRQTSRRPTPCCKL